MLSYQKKMQLLSKGVSKSPLQYSKKIIFSYFVSSCLRGYELFRLEECPAQKFLDLTLVYSDNSPTTKTQRHEE